jgi:hypothetical protein
LQELLRGKNFAADDAIQVWYQAFDFANAAFFDPDRETLIHDEHTVLQARKYALRRHGAGELHMKFFQTGAVLFCDSSRRQTSANRTHPQSPEGRGSA